MRYISRFLAVLILFPLLAQAGAATEREQVIDALNAVPVDHAKHALWKWRYNQDSEIQLSGSDPSVGRTGIVVLGRQTMAECSDCKGRYARLQVELESIDKPATPAQPAPSAPQSPITRTPGQEVFAPVANRGAMSPGVAHYGVRWETVYGPDGTPMQVAHSEPNEFPKNPAEVRALIKANEMAAKAAKKEQASALQKKQSGEVGLEAYRPARETAVRLLKEGKITRQEALKRMRFIPPTRAAILDDYRSGLITYESAMQSFKEDAEPKAIRQAN